MNLFFFLKSLLQRMMRWLQVFFLVDVLFFNVRIDLHIFDSAVFHIWVQLLVNWSLQLVMIIDVLNNFVHSILETLNVNIISSNPSSWFSDKFTHFFLTSTQVINKDTIGWVNCVATFQFIVHLPSVSL